MSNDEQQPVEEPRGIEVRVIGGGAPAGWERVEDEEEQVVRLRKTGVTGVRSMEDVEPHREVAESGRSRRRGWSQRTVTLLMAGVMGLLIIGALAGVMWQRGKSRAESRDKGPRVEMGFAEGENPNDPFLEKTERYLTGAREQLGRLAEMSDPAKVAEIVRHGPDLRGLLERRWSPPNVNDQVISQLKIDVEEDEAGRDWAVLSGNNAVAQSLRFVFVPEGDELMFDWAASVGANERGLDGFRHAGPGAEEDFRVEVRKDHFYGARFPEEDFVCLKMTDVFNDAVAWAYARRGSAVAEAVEAELHVGGTILEEEEMARMILRVRQTGAGDDGQFELIGVPAGDWIRWEKE